MAISDVSLTSGMRSNLLSLQGTVDLLDRTQGRLASGKKVNTAMDNPISFFAAQSLNSRASVIDSLKDAMGQAVQTVTAADKGITAISSMIEQAKGIAQSALSAASSATTNVSTVGAVAFANGTVEVDTSAMTSMVAGTVGVDVSGMTSWAAGTVSVDVATMTSWAAGTVSVNVSGMTSMTAGTVGVDVSGMTSMTAGTVGVDVATMTSWAAGTVDINVGTMTRFDSSDVDFAASLTAGDHVDIGAATFTAGGAGSEYTDLTSLRDLINASVTLGGYTAVLTNGNTQINISTDRVVAGTISGNGVAFAVTVNTTGTVGSTVDISGQSYMLGATATGFADETALVAVLSVAGFTASHISGATTTVHAAITGTTVSAAKVSGNAAFVTTNAEVQGTTVAISGTNYMMGRAATGFANATELLAVLTDVGFAASSLSGTTAVTAGITGTTINAASVSGVTTSLNAEVAGTTVTVSGTSYMMGRAATGFANATELLAVLTGASFAASSLSGTTVTAATTGTTVSGTNVTGATNVTVNAETLGTTVNIAGEDYMLGRAATGFANATELLAVLTGASFSASSRLGTAVTAAISGATVDANDVTGATGVTVDAEVAATVLTVGGTGFTAIAAGATPVTGAHQFRLGATATAAATNLMTAIQTAALSGSTSRSGAEVTYIASSSELTSLENQYNTVRDQLTALAEDSGYKGKNLLSADTLVVKFEGANLTIAGFDASATGLGISGATWTTAGGSSIDADITALGTATSTLSQESSKMSGNLSIINVRQTFSTNMINTLTAGSDKLTLADTNEEGASMLMLQTRQSLSISALSMSAQAAQSVLQLFR